MGECLCFSMCMCAYLYICSETLYNLGKYLTSFPDWILMCMCVSVCVCTCVSVRVHQCVCMQACERVHLKRDEPNLKFNLALNLNTYPGGKGLLPGG